MHVSVAFVQVFQALILAEVVFALPGSGSRLVVLTLGVEKFFILVSGLSNMPVLPDTFKPANETRLDPSLL